MEAHIITIAGNRIKEKRGPTQGVARIRCRSRSFSVQ